MQKPEYVSNVAACLIDPAVAFAMWTTGIWIGCGVVLNAAM